MCLEEALEAQGETEEESESMVIFAFLSGQREPDIDAAFATNSKLPNESLNHGIIDTGCTSSVCGAVWFDLFMRNLSPEVVVETFDSSTQILFGNMGRQTVVFSVKIPRFIRAGRPRVVSRG